MTSIVRRAFAGRSLLHRPLIYSRNSRSYASHPEQEVDYDLDNYPKLPDVSRQHLPAKGWQDMTLRRNLGDPVGVALALSIMFTNCCQSAPRTGRTVLDVGS